MNDIRSYLELTNFVAGIIIAIVGIAGLRQLSLFKKDMRLRNERAAKERAIEYSLRYLTTYVPLAGEFYRELKSKKMKVYSGPVGDFTRDSIPKEMHDSALERYKMESWLKGMNELLAISSAFTTGVADEETGFQIFGRTFCNTVRSHYDVLSIPRSKDIHNYFQSIVDLYHVWSPRLSKAELEEQQKRLNKQILDQPSSHIPPIGCD